MQLQDPCVRHVLQYLNETLPSAGQVTFQEVTGAKVCQKYTVRQIGEALELLRRNGLVKAASRFGCSELLSFTAFAVTEEGTRFLKAK